MGDMGGVNGVYWYSKGCCVGKYLTVYLYPTVPRTATLSRPQQTPRTSEPNVPVCHLSLPAVINLPHAQSDRCSSSSIGTRRFTTSGSTKPKLYRDPKVHHKWLDRADQYIYRVLTRSFESISLADGLGHMFGDTALQPTRGTPAKVNPCNSGRHRILKIKGLAWDEMRSGRGRWVGIRFGCIRNCPVVGRSSSIRCRQVGENLSKNFKTLRNLARLNQTSESMDPQGTVRQTSQIVGK